MGNCEQRDEPPQSFEDADPEGVSMQNTTVIYQEAEVEQQQDLGQLPLHERTRAILREGTLRLLSATWLMSQGHGFVIQRQQELPGEAFVPPEEAVVLLDKMFGIVALSYGWLSQWHPDPAGFHMQILLQYLKKHMNRFHKFQDVGIFWDFAALPQYPEDGERSEDEEWLFQRGLGAVTCLYGGQKTVVLQLTRVPEDAPVDEDEGFYRNPYLLRGWCFFETTVAGLLKDADQLLDLGMAAEELNDTEQEWDQVQEKARGARVPPLTPEDMAAELANRQFSVGNDIEFLCESYSQFFREAASTVTWLWFENASGREGWGDDEMQQFARALPAFAQCQAIRLWGHTAVGEEGLAALRAQLPEQTALGRLLLPKHLEATDEGKAVKSAWARAGKTPGNLLWC